MTCSPSARTIICSEIFDENSLPSEEEIKEYALRIGINPDSEPHLLDLAKDGLMQALPAEWKPCYDANAKAWYYFNFKTGESTWEHPLDEVYRKLVKIKRSESISSAGEEDSKTSLRDDMKSYEEAMISETVSKAAAESSKSTTGAIKKGNLHLAPLKKSSSALAPLISPNKLEIKDLPGNKRPLSATQKLTQNRRSLDVQVPMELPLQSSNAEFPRADSLTTPPRIELSNKEPAPLRVDIPSPSARIDIDKMDMSSLVRSDTGKKERLQSAQEKHPRSMHGRAELTLTGGGSIFLKSKQTKSEQLTPSFGEHDSSLGDVLSVSSRDDSAPKGILREQRNSAVKQLWDVDPREMSFEEKQLWKKQELEEERKSVRFNLDKELNICFNMSESEDGEEPVEDEDMIDEYRWTSKLEVGERTIASAKVKDVLDIIDASDLVDLELNSKFQSSLQDEKLETQIARQIELNGDTDDLPILLSHKQPSTKHITENGMFESENLSMKDYESGSSESEILPKILEITNNKSSVMDDAQIVKSTANLTLSPSLEIYTSPNFPLSPIGKQNFENCNNIDLVGFKKYPSNNNVLSKNNSEDSISNSEKKDDLKQQRILEEYKQKLQYDFETTLQKLKETHEAELNKIKNDFVTRESEEKQNLKLDLEKKLAEFKFNLENEKLIQEQSIRAQIQESLKNLQEQLMKDNENELCKLRQEHSDLVTQLETELLEETTSLQKRLSDIKLINAESESKMRKENEEMLQLLEAKLKLEREKHEDDIKSKHQKELAEIEANYEKNQQEKRLEAEKTQQEQAILKSEHDIILKNLDDELKHMQDKLAVELTDLEKQYELQRQILHEKFETERTELETVHKMNLQKLREEHADIIENMALDFRKQEECMRHEHAERLEEIREKLEAERSRIRQPDGELEAAKQELAETNRIYEKLRCEKRLLEDKYRSLKEKYIRLKTDVKLSIERRKRREGGTTTGSETEKSTSHKAAKVTVEVDRSCSESHSPKINQSEHNITDEVNSTSNSINNNYNNVSKKSHLSPDMYQKPGKVHISVSPTGDGIDSDNVSSASISKHHSKPSKHSGVNENVGRKRRQLFGRLKAASTTRLPHNNNNSNPNNTSSSIDEEVTCSCTPVENLRRQLQKLEDLEDQFPPATHTDTYLRYPFSDSGQFGSSELEFFRHRIHLERDSVRRAKDFLRVQRNKFLSRQHELKQRQVQGNTTARTMLDQLYQEERELTDMEVSLHRTRSLLGEKIIRLRHLEQSLHRAGDKKSGIEDATLSDLSSHSGSSGFSSTDTQPGRNQIPRGAHYQESSEIIQSLENLNAEIREIWDVLNKQQEDGAFRSAVPPPPMMYPDMGWPTLTGTRPMPTQLRPGLDPSLVERTRSLRDWLRQARLDTTDLLNPCQATL